MAKNKKQILENIKKDPAYSLRLLDEEDLNTGTIFDVAPSNEAGKIGTPVRLMDLSCPSRKGEFITITFCILPRTNNLFDPENASGPLIGIVEFGNGSGYTQVEIDIPLGSGFLSATSGGALPPGMPTVVLGGVALSVPGSSVRVFARNDARFAPYPPSPAEIGSSTNPARVSAHASYGIRPSAVNGLTRTEFFGSFLSTAASNLIPTNTGVIVGIPPFAKSVQILRGNLMNAPSTGSTIRIETFSRELFATWPGRVVQRFEVVLATASDPLPVLTLSGIETSVKVTNLGANPGINNINAGFAAMFQIGL